MDFAFIVYGKLIIFYAELCCPPTCHIGLWKMLLHGIVLSFPFASCRALPSRFHRWHTIASGIQLSVSYFCRFYHTKYILLSHWSPTPSWSPHYRTHTVCFAVLCSFRSLVFFFCYFVSFVVFLDTSAPIPTSVSLPVPFIICILFSIVPAEHGASERQQFYFGLKIGLQ